MERLTIEVPNYSYKKDNIKERINEEQIFDWGLEHMLAHQLFTISFSNIISNLFDNINGLASFSNIYDLIIINKVKCFIETRYQQKICDGRRGINFKWVQVHYTTTSVPLSVLSFPTYASIFGETKKWTRWLKERLEIKK